MKDKTKTKPIPTPSPSSKLKGNFGHSKDYIEKIRRTWKPLGVDIKNEK